MVLNQYMYVQLSMYHKPTVPCILSLAKYHLYIHFFFVAINVISYMIKFICIILFCKMFLLIQFIVDYFCQSSDFNLFLELIIVRIDLLLIAIINLFELKTFSVQYVQYVLHIKFIKSVFLTYYFSQVKRKLSE